MIYEMRYYNSKNDWKTKNDSCFIAWENKDAEAKNNFEISGKLLKYLGDSNKKFEVPKGIETIGACVFVNPRWDIFDSNIQEVIIPASVKKIEEGAFEWTEINKITIHPDSPCGVVINDGLYTKDGKTLLWILKKIMKRDMRYQTA